MDEDVITTAAELKFEEDDVGDVDNKTGGDMVAVDEAVTATAAVDDDMVANVLIIVSAAAAAAAATAALVATVC